MVASPLVAVAFDGASTRTTGPAQTYWLFFQTANGNIKQSVRENGAVNSDWQTAQ